MTNLPTDTYYRGYRLSTDPDNTIIRFGVEVVETAINEDHAKMIIDEWMNAR